MFQKKVIIQFIMPPTHDCLKMKNYKFKHYLHIGLWLLLLCLQPPHLNLCFFLRLDKFNWGWDCKVGELTFGGVYMVMFSLLEEKCHFMAKS